MKSTPLALVLALAFGATAVNAAQTVSTEGWCQVSTPEFTVISQMSVSDTADWAGRINQFIHAMRGRLPVDHRLLGPFTLVLFKSNSDYWNSVPVLKSGEPLAHLAAFSRSGGWGSLAATCDMGTSTLTQRMVLETCVNWLLSADHRHRPMALQTGLAEVYGGYLIENGEEIFGRPFHGWTSRLQRAELNSLNNAETLLTVEDLLALKDINPVSEVHGVGLYSVESWGFVHFLLFSKEMANSHAMDRLLNAFAHHRSPHDALRDAFGEGADTINSSFRAYIQGGDFYEISMPVKPAPLAGPPMPADPAVVASVLSRLETSARHLDVAHSYAEQALRLAPNDPRPHEALALLDFIAHRDAETVADCQEAIRLGTKDAWTWYEASMEVGRTGAGAANAGGHVHLTPEQAREAVNAAENAILLSRGLETAYARVAAHIGTADKVTEDDGKFLAQGRVFFPNNGWIEIGHAQWAHRTNDNALALKILDDVLARSSALTPEEVDRARALHGEWSRGPS